ESCAASSSESSVCCCTATRASDSRPDGRGDHMDVLVIGGTGTVGSWVVRELLARGAHVRVLTRSAEHSKTLPAGAKPVIGDLLDPATVRSVFDGVEGLFLLNPVSMTESHEGLMALNGARMARVRRLAYLSVHHVDRAPHLPH